AARPRITRVTPLPSQPSIVARSRMPPPSWTGIATASTIRSTAAALTGLPAKAPSRSTTWRYSNPCASKACACAAGSRWKTVARAMSPCSSRTHCPSLRSMAGKRITRRPSRLPLQKIGDQLEPQALALLRMELGTDHGVAPHDSRDRTAVVGFGDEVGALGRLEMERVHEIGVQPRRPDRDAVEQRMRPPGVER